MGADSLAERIPQMPQNSSAQFVYPSPKVWDFNEKRLHWASVGRDSFDGIGSYSAAVVGQKAT